jgi:cytochrome c biogenesis factor
MLIRMESITRIIVFIFVLFSLVDYFVELTWINQGSPYFFMPILILAVTNIALQIINFYIKKKRKGSIDT